MTGLVQLTLTYQWGNGSGYPGAALPNSRVVVDGLDLQAFLDSTHTAHFALPTDPDSVKTQMIKVAGIDPSIAGQVGVAIQNNPSGGQTLIGPSFSEEIPAGVIWYALSEADNLNHLVELTITDNGSDFSASANVWLCRIDTGGGGTASALPTLAIMMVMLGGAMSVMGVVVKKERTRLPVVSRLGMPNRCQPFRMRWRWFVISFGLPYRLFKHRGQTPTSLKSHSHFWLHLWRHFVMPLDCTKSSLVRCFW